jgi:ribose transport system substrate-binding protein
MPPARPSPAARHALIAAGLAASLVLPACRDEERGSGAARGDTTQVASGGAGKTIAVVLPTRADPFWQQFQTGLQEAARRGDYKLRVESAEGDTARQRSAIEQALGGKVDALLLAPIDPASAGSAAARVAQSKVPLFTAGVSTADRRVIAHVASDDAGGGEVAATYIATFLRGRGEVAVVGLPGTQAGDAREAAFRRALATQKGMKVTAGVSGGGTREGARVATDTLLKAHPEVDALFVTSEAMTLGALDAVRGRGRQELVVVGYGLSPEAQQAIAQETPLKAVIVESPRTMGMRALQVVAEHLSNEGVPPRLAVGVRLVTIGNLNGKN